MSSMGRDKGRNESEGQPIDSNMSSKVHFQPITGNCFQTGLYRMNHVQQVGD